MLQPLMCLWASSLRASQAFLFPAARRLRQFPVAARAQRMKLQPLSSAGAETKTLALIRHGQGYHNPSRRNCCVGWLASILFFRDAGLTPRGREQASRLRRELLADAGHPLHGAELVISTPLRRALETALAIFGADGGPRRFVSALHTECCLAPCHCGRAPSELTTLLPEAAGWEGLKDLPDVWWPAGRSWAQESRPLDRVHAFKEMIAGRPESVIAVVGHARFFQTMMGQRMGNCEVLWVSLDTSSLEVKVLK
mmetsp:Transcript_32349/g.75081  ORF Transcript_32349/g.75081 Transcript_32349/m.75081 type:complete len:254 (-) Transcript_32349:82-843(-)